MINLAEKVGLLVSQLSTGPIGAVSLELWGIEERLRKILSVAATKGLLSPRLSESVNFVNALSVAETRGITLSSTVHATPVDYANLITLRAHTADREVCVSGTVFSEKDQRIVSVNEFRVEFKPVGYVVYMVNEDVPGVVGKVGTILGDRDINIAEYNLARAEGGGLATAIVTIDSPLDEETLAFLRSFREMKDVRLLRL